MINNSLIIIPDVTDSEQVCDFLLQTAKKLARDNTVVIPVFHQNSQDFVDENGIYFIKFREFLPLRRFKLVNKLNKIIFMLGLQFWAGVRFLNFGSLSRQNRFEWKLRKKYVWLFFPELADTIKMKIPGWQLIFDIVDFYYSPDVKKQQILNLQKKSVLKKTDFIFAISQALKNKYQHFTHKKITIVPQGFAIESFSLLNKPTRLKFPKGKPIIGFVGQMSQRLDFKLLKDVVKKNPQWNFVFVGPKHHEPNVATTQKNDEFDDLLKNPNFYYFGRQPRNTILDILKKFDVCLIPYDVSLPFNRYSYPMKLFEYFYAGKPVVSTPIEALKQFSGLVKLIDSEVTFTQAVKKILKQKWTVDKVKKQQYLAQENSWQKKLEKISEKLNSSSKLLKKNRDNRFIKGFFVIFLNIFLIGIVFLVAETLMRVKILGFHSAMKSYLQPVQQPSVLGVSDWVIADPDLNYRLNPAREHVNSLSIQEKELTIPKPKGIKRILILGDSLPVTGDPTFADLLKVYFKSSPQFEIINAGVPGYTTYQEVLFFKKYLSVLEPDLVLLTYCLNDNYTFLHTFDEDANMLWTPEAKKSLSINTWSDFLINKSYFLTFVKNSFFSNLKKEKPQEYPWEDAVDFNIAWKDYSWPSFGKNLSSLKKMVKGMGGELEVVIFPLEYQLEPELVKNSFAVVTKPQRKVLGYCDKLELSCLDLWPAFYQLNSSTEQLFTDGVHLSSAGHELAFEKIIQFLNQNYLLYK